MQALGDVDRDAVRRPITDFRESGIPTAKEIMRKEEIWSPAPQQEELEQQGLPRSDARINTSRVIRDRHGRLVSDMARIFRDGCYPTVVPTKAVGLYLAKVYPAGTPREGQPIFSPEQTRPLPVMEFACEHPDCVGRFADEFDCDEHIQVKHPTIWAKKERVRIKQEQEALKAAAAVDYEKLSAAVARSVVSSLLALQGGEPAREMKQQRLNPAASERMREMHRKRREAKEKETVGVPA